MSNRLANKVAIVTGSSSGIGRAICLHYAAEGAILVCADLDPAHPQAPPNDNENNDNNNNGNPPPEPTTHDLITQRTGRPATFIRTDVSSASQVSHLIATTVQTHGRLDVMVNNAGIGVTNPRPIWALEPETWDRMLAVNARGVFLGIKYASAQMLLQDPLPGSASRGWIINAASVLGLTGQSLSAEYCASKGLVVNLTKAAALDCAPKGIHVNAFAPGYAVTGMTRGLFGDDEVRRHLERVHPLGGFGTPEDLAGVCVFLASEEAKWVTGATIPVDGGFMAGNFIPSLGVFSH